MFAATEWLGFDPFAGPLAGLAKLMPTLRMTVLLFAFYVTSFPVYQTIYGAPS